MNCPLAHLLEDEIDRGYIRQSLAHRDACIRQLHTCVSEREPGRVRSPLGRLPVKEEGGVYKVDEVKPAFQSTAIWRNSFGGWKGGDVPLGESAHRPGTQRRQPGGDRWLFAGANEGGATTGHEPGRRRVDPRRGEDCPAAHWRFVDASRDKEIPPSAR